MRLWRGWSWGRAWRRWGKNRTTEDAEGTEMGIRRGLTARTEAAKWIPCCGVPPEQWGAFEELHQRLAALEGASRVVGEGNAGKGLTAATRIVGTPLAAGGFEIEVFGRDLVVGAGGSLEIGPERSLERQRVALAAASVAGAGASTTVEGTSETVQLMTWNQGPG